MLTDESHDENRFHLSTVQTCNRLICFSGSPFTVNVGGHGTGRLKESIMRERRAADVSHIGSQCELSLKIPGKPYCLCFLLTNNLCRREGRKTTDEKKSAVS